MNPLILTTISTSATSTAAAGRPRRVLLWVIIVALIVSVWAAPKLVKHLQAVELRRECMNYDPPADQIVVEEDPTAVAALASNPIYQRGAGGRLFIVPDFWKEENPSAHTQGTLFLHSRTSRDGNVRLVGLDLNMAPGLWIASTGDVEDKSLVETIITPGRALAPDTIKQSCKIVMWICPTNPIPMRFFAGQADPNDPSHFTFDYQRGNSRGTLDGYLSDDDSITITTHQGILRDDRAPIVWDPDGGK